MRVEKAAFVALICVVEIVIISLMGLYIGWFIGRNLSPIANSLTTALFGVVGFAVGVKLLWRLALGKWRKR
jgi:uncharacterized protein YebE (UPF0316 family)